MELNAKCPFARSTQLPLAPTGGDLKVGLYLPKSEAITPIISLTPNLIHAAHDTERACDGGEYGNQYLEQLAPVEGASALAALHSEWCGVQ